MAQSPTAAPFAAAHSAERRAGALYALGAYGVWAIFPLYWKTLVSIPALEILAHRIVWSLAFVSLLIALRRQWQPVRAAFASRRNLLPLLASTMLVAVNWLVFIWAVNSNQVLQTSLGYFINPLVNVFLGMVVLGERLRRLQLVSVLLAGFGVTYLGIALQLPPWIALTLAFCFGFYGLLRKTMPVGALPGLAVETLVMTPLALAYLVWLGLDGSGVFTATAPGIDLLLAFGGVATALPLLWVAEAARRMPYATLGQFQYIGPTGHFLLATLVFGEQLTQAHLVTFACIWVAVGLYVFDSRRPAPA